jgi:hypothetical protein
MKIDRPSYGKVHRIGCILDTERSLCDHPIGKMTSANADYLRKHQHAKIANKLIHGRPSDEGG